jgi:hypothetical protein
MNLIRGGFIRSSQQQLGTWEPSKHLLEDERKPWHEAEVQYLGELHTSES